MEEEGIELTSEDNNWNSNVEYPGRNNDLGLGSAGIDSTVVWPEGWGREAAPRCLRVVAGIRDNGSRATTLTLALTKEYG